MIFPSIVATGFVAFIASQLGMPFSSLALQWETYFAAFNSKISPKVRSKCLIEASILGTADIHSVYTRELLIELGAQSQMISIRMIQLLIISICVKMSSSYKVGQVIGENVKKQGGPMTLLCGTPLLLKSYDDTASRTWTRCNLFWR